MTQQSAGHLRGHTLGPYRIERLLGEGGMGQVWLANYTQLDLDVAIKCLTAKRARQRRHRQALRREILTLARLRHPGIVSVLDANTVQPAEADALDHAIVAGTPYLVMEYVPHAPWRVISKTLTVNALFALTFDVLDALAHAHAQGMLHRDIKPGNLLVAPYNDEPWDVRLTDFGIARPMFQLAREAGDASTPPGLQGTPGFMAPEQIRRQAHLEGPWTDLYALGCTLWWICSGQRLFEATDGIVMLFGHLNNPLPDMSTSIVGRIDGFERWLKRMLSRDISDRFQHAADAAHALTRWVPSAREPTVSNLRSSSMVLRLDLDGPTVVSAPDFDDIVETPGDAQPPLPAAPIPQSWRRVQHTNDHPMPLLGTGMNLFRVRHLELVGRQVERDQLWQRLIRVFDHQAFEVAIIRGPSGVGKSKLASWLAQRASEVGAARVLRVTHSAQSGPFDGLGPMLGRLFPSTQGRREETRQLLEDLFAPDDDPVAQLHVRILTSMMPDVRSREIAVLVERQGRLTALIALLERLAQRRPVILWLDDVQWGDESLALVLALMQLDIPPPVLVVGTVQDEALALMPEASRAMLNQILNHQHTLTLQLPPPTPREQQRLIMQLLPLASDLMDTIIERTGNNPLFAVQLVRDWATRGVLVQNDDAFFVLPEGVHVALPDNLHEVWCDRVEHLVKTSGAPVAQQRHALEIAAALGRDVSLDEWRAVCAASALDTLDLDALIDRLVEQRLAYRDEHGWAFTHHMLRESLVRQAQDAGRWSTHQRHCADVLRIDANNDPEHLARVADHTLAAGDPGGALEPLLTAARLFFETGWAERVAAQLDRYDLALDRLNASPDDPRRVKGMWLRAAVARLRGEPDRVLEWVGAAMPRAVALHDYATQGHLLRLEGMAHRDFGYLKRAQRSFDAAIAAFERSEDRDGLAWAQLSLGAALLRKRDFDAALQYVARAAAHFAKTGQTHVVAECELVEANTYYRWGQLERARVQLEALQAREDTRGLSMLHALAATLLGDIARGQGRLLDARKYFLRTVDYWRPFNVNNTFIAQFNLGMVEVALHHYRHAAMIFDALLERCDRLGSHTSFPSLHWGRLACAVVDGDERLAREQLTQAAAWMARVDDVLPEQLWLGEEVVRLMVAHGMASLVEEARALALRQYARVGDEAAVARLSDALETIAWHGKGA